VHKDEFDAALQPGFRRLTADAYRALNAAQEDDAASRLDAAVRRRACPLCGDDGAQPAVHVKHGLEVVRCQRCPMIYSRVILDEEAERAFYGLSGFQASYLALKRNDAYASLERRKCAYLVERAAQAAPQAQRFLEIGSGAGRLLEAAREAGWSALGVEPNPAFAAEGRRRGLEVLDGWFPQTPPPERGWFDVIAMLDVLEHAADPVALLTGARSRLGSDGLLMLQVPNYDSLLLQLEGDASPVICQGHWNYFTRDSLTRCGEQSGFKAVVVETIITELDRIAQLPETQVRETVRRVCGTAPPTGPLTASWLHERFLGFKLLALFRAA
jgi:SAM-dependent methyltransferase